MTQITHSEPCIWDRGVPVLAPYNGFDFYADSPTAMAVRTMAMLLCDDEWHLVTDVVMVATNSSGLAWRMVRELVNRLHDHGDVRISRKKIRLTTRWGLRPMSVQDPFGEALR